MKYSGGRRISISSILKLFCSLLYLSIIVLYFISFSLLCGILDYGEYGYTIYEIIKYSLGYNNILCRYTLFSVEFSSFAI